MRQKLFSGKNYDKRCEYCLKGKLPADRSVVLCRKFGVVSTDYVCRGFRYDPLKRIPNRTKLKSVFDEDEFSL